jgi:dipeptidyl aminopeptidase/acylaminoacyl peptidase
MRVAKRLWWILPIAPAFLACSDPTRPEPLDVPAFVFVSNAEGVPALFRFEADVITRLSASGNDDREPHSAAGRVVFTSRRDGNPEIYTADLSLAGQVRLTTTSATDDAPALDPTGTTIAFVSTRSGTPRIWLMDVTGSNPRVLATGSATLVPEGSPSWSPDGTRIAFTSTRTNTSQVHVMPVAGGAAVQVSHEATGAFTPEWAADGQSVIYMMAAGEPRLMRVPATGGDVSSFAADEGGISEPSCRGAICLAVAGALNGPGDLIVISASGRSRRTILARAPDDRQPAVLVP